MRPSWLGLVVGLMVACGGGQPAPETPPASAPAEGGTTPGESPPPSAPEPDGRALSATADFGMLVQAIRELDGASRGDSDAGCILRGGRRNEPARIEADLAAAIHPIPNAPTDFERRLADPQVSARVLTRWGARGSGDIAVVALTATPPTGEGAIISVLVGNEGVWLLSSAGSLPGAVRGPFEMSRLGTNLGGVLEGATMLMVTAEGRVPVSRVRAALEAIPASAPPVALGLVLQAETRLPAAGGPPPSQAGMCETTPFADVDEGWQPGELTAAELRGALDPLGEAGRRCFAVVSGEAARGGRITVRFRIGPEGRVVSRCATQDTMGDATLRQCVLGAVDGLVFPRPRDGQYVEVALPVRLSPDDSMRHEPVCR